MWENSNGDENLEAFVEYLCLSYDPYVETDNNEYTHYYCLHSHGVLP